MNMVDLFRLNKHISKVNRSCRRVIVLHKFLLTLSCLSVSNANNKDELYTAEKGGYYG